MRPCPETFPRDQPQETNHAMSFEVRPLLQGDQNSSVREGLWEREYDGPQKLDQRLR